MDCFSACSHIYASSKRETLCSILKTTAQKVFPFTTTFHNGYKTYTSPPNAKIYVQIEDDSSKHFSDDIP